MKVTQLVVTCTRAFMKMLGDVAAAPCERIAPSPCVSQQIGGHDACGEGDRGPAAGRSREDEEAAAYGIVLDRGIAEVIGALSAVWLTPTL